MTRRSLAVCGLAALAALPAGCGSNTPTRSERTMATTATAESRTTSSHADAARTAALVAPRPGRIPRLLDPHDVYRAERPGHLVPRVRADRALVYVPYNLYFTADGRRAIVVAEANRRLDFREPHTMRLRHSLAVPQCPGVDHMDYTSDGRTALVSCEFGGRMIVVDLVHEKVLRTIALRPGAMPQDVKLSPDGRTFYVADMASDGVWEINAHTWRKERFQPTGRGAHGLYPSRDARRLYVSNRDEGSITLISFRTRRPVKKWWLPGGGSPDMGGVSANGRTLWLTGRYNGVVYGI